jgi:hypothetical protein
MLAHEEAERAGCIPDGLRRQYFIRFIEPIFADFFQCAAEVILVLGGFVCRIRYRRIVQTRCALRFSDTLCLGVRILLGCGSGFQGGGQTPARWWIKTGEDVIEWLFGHGVALVGCVNS